MLDTTLILSNTDRLATTKTDAILKRFRRFTRGPEIGDAHETKSLMYVGCPTDHPNWRM